MQFLIFVFSPLWYRMWLHNSNLYNTEKKWSCLFAPLRYGLILPFSRVCCRSFWFNPNVSTWDILSRGFFSSCSLHSRYFFSAGYGKFRVRLPFI